MLFHFSEWDLDNFLFLCSSIRYFRNLAGFFAQSPDVIVKCADRNPVIITVRQSRQSGKVRFFRKYPFSAFKHCHAYSIIIVVFLQEIIR